MSDDQDREYRERSRSRDRDNDDRDNWKRGDNEASGTGESNTNAEGQSTNLYVRNLNLETTEESLRAAFVEFGEVTSASIVKEPVTSISRGFGFVAFRHAEDAERALEAMTNGGSLVDGRTVRIEKARRSGGYEKTPGRYLGPPGMAMKNQDRYARGPPRNSRDRGHPSDRDSYRSGGPPSYSSRDYRGGGGGPPSRHSDYGSYRDGPPVYREDSRDGYGYRGGGPPPRQHDGYRGGGPGAGPPGRGQGDYGSYPPSGPSRGGYDHDVPPPGRHHDYGGYDDRGGGYAPAQNYPSRGGGGGRGGDRGRDW